MDYAVKLQNVFVSPTKAMLIFLRKTQNFLSAKQ